MPRTTTKKSGASKPTKKSSKGKKSSKKSSKKEGATSRKWKAGTVALREIRKLQKGTQLLIQRAPFYRLVRDGVMKLKGDVSIRASALNALQEAAESYMVSLFEGAVMLQLHRNKQTLNVRDVNFTRRLRGELSPEGK